ncbi:MAG: alpha/beta hydrolase [Pseudohongiella sp.]|nr:alpha/beta hydrolase [Pseudohongiella sp.]
MFSRADADQLRESLAAIKFPATFADPASVESGVDTSVRNLVRAYREHYGLDFDTPSTTVAHTLGIVESGPYKIVCQYFVACAAEAPSVNSPANPSTSRGTVFLLHGYFDHGGIYGHLIRHCLQLGFAVVIFDFPGHGLSSGAVASIGSFREYNQVFFDCLLAAQQQSVAGPWTVIGQSTGGAIIIDSLLDDNRLDSFSIRQYLLLNPLLRPSHWGRGKLLFALSRWFFVDTKRQFSNNSHDREFLRFLQQEDNLQSKFLSRRWILAMIDYQRRFAKAAGSDKKLSIIQGTDDGTVDWHYNLPKIMEKFPASKSYQLKDARHHLVNESAEYRDKAFSLISQIVDQPG